MSVQSPPEISPEFSRLIVGNPPAPPKLQPTDNAKTRSEILTFLTNLDMFVLAIVDPGGWPVTSCMHFVAVADSEQRPVLYLNTHEHTRKFRWIPENPRVAVACYAQHGGQPVDAAGPLAKLQGLCRFVDHGSDEKLAAVAALKAKPGYEFLQMMPPDDQPMLRIDVVRAVWRATPHDQEQLVEFQPTLIAPSL